MPNQIDIILNGKGGVGKSFFDTNVVQFVKDRKARHRAISDNENSTLKRFPAESEQARREMA